MTRLAAYTIDNIESADTPFLAVYPEVIGKNIRRLLRLFPDKGRLRPHVKTHKCPRVIQLLMEAGITKSKCATIAEAEMLALAGAADVLLAYQPVGPKVTRFLELMMAYPACSFSCLVDNEASARQISDAALGSDLLARAWVDLNVGMGRTGVPPGEEARELYRYCGRLEGITVAGLHAYDGHITDPCAAARLARAEAGFAAVRELAGDLARSGFGAPRLVAGSTPTIQFYARQQDVECSPGTFVYWDQHYQDLYPELAFENAALVVTRVVSKPSPTTACLDLGYKAVSSEGEPEERVKLPDLPGYRIISQSEEHLLVSAGTSQLPVGEAVYGLPFHIGRTCNLYEECAVIEQRRIREHWPHTARTRRIHL